MSEFQLGNEVKLLYLQEVFGDAETKTIDWFKAICAVYVDLFLFNICSF